MGRWALQSPPQLAAGSLPDPVQLDSLRPYLGPSGSLPAWLQDPALPATPELARRSRSGPDPWRDPPSEAESMPVQHRVYTLSAIVSQPGRRIAMIDSQQVRVGDVLPGGVRVARIEDDHVLLRGPDGSRQVVWMTKGER